MTIRTLRGAPWIFALGCLSCSRPGTSAPTDTTDAAPSATSMASGSAVPPASAAPIPDPLDLATPVLPPAMLEALGGCWERPGSDERWQLDRSGASGMTVTRHVGPGTGDYEARAKIPTPLLYNPAQSTFGFTAAGRIHELLFVFTRVDEGLLVDSFSHRQPSAPFHSTGSQFTVQRCAAPPKKR